MWSLNNFGNHIIIIHNLLLIMCGTLDTVYHLPNGGSYSIGRKSKDLRD